MNPNDHRPIAPSEADPYSFIMDTEHHKKKKLLSTTGHKSLKGRLLMTLGVGLGIALAIILFSTLVLSSKTKNSQALISLLAQQQEISRIADLGVKQASDPATVGLAETVKLSVSTDQIQLTAYLHKKKQKISATQLNAEKNTKTDEALTAALKTNTFDKEFTRTIKASLTEYQMLLKSSYDKADNETTKSILNRGLTSTAALLK